MDKATRRAKEKRLAEAEAAYHEILIGGSVKVLVDQNGERIEYQASNRGALAAYIQLLKTDLGLISCTGPMRAFF